MSRRLRGPKAGCCPACGEDHQPTVAEMTASGWLRREAGARRKILCGCGAELELLRAPDARVHVDQVDEWHPARRVAWLAGQPLEPEVVNLEDDAGGELLGRVVAGSR